MQAKTSTQALAAIVFVAVQKFFLELPRWAQLNVLVVELFVMGIVSILLWRGDSCRKPAHEGGHRAVVPQPLVLVPLKGERDDAQSDVETETTVGSDGVGTDTESTAGADCSDWSSSDEDCDMLFSAAGGCSGCLPGAAWGVVGMRLATVFHLEAFEPIMSEDEEWSPSVAGRTEGRKSAVCREDVAFERTSADDEDGSSSIATASRLAPAPTPTRNADADPWLTIGCRLSAALGKISADDGDDFPQAIHSLSKPDDGYNASLIDKHPPSPMWQEGEVDANQWSIVGRRLAVALLKMTQGEPMESDDEDGF